MSKLQRAACCLIAGALIRLIDASPAQGFAQEMTGAANVIRTDTKIASAPGIEIVVREVRSSADAEQFPILLIHGGGPAGLASFDLSVPGYSLAADLAAAGLTVYIMDVRGFGGSTRPAAMSAPPLENPPAGTVEEAAQDIGAVVDWIRQRANARAVALFGWASGGHWAAYYTASHNEKVSSLAVLNSLYGVDAPWPYRTAFESPQQPGQFNARMGAYILSDAATLLARWNRSIPSEDKSKWRDPRVEEGYVRAALAGDPTSSLRQPPSMRIPTGFRLEAYEMSRGRKYWDARDIHVPTLVMRGERDFWSRPADMLALERELPDTSAKRFVTIPGGTHYLANDRPERGRALLIAELVTFVKGQTGGADH